MRKKKDDITKIRKKLAKERKKNLRKEKINKNLKLYVREADTIQPRYTGRNADRKEYDYKCPECNFVSARLQYHMVTKHEYEEKEARLLESKIRVMYSWAQKNKHGVAKPLPCEECGVWLSRLNDHLINKLFNYIFLSWKNLNHVHGRRYLPLGHNKT